MRLKKRLHRKANDVMMWPVVLIVLALLFFIFFLLFVKKNADAAEASSEQTTCRSSVAASAKFGTDIDCPMEFVKVKTKDKQEAKKQIADAMVRCWDNYGRGELRVFGGEDTKFCAVCSVVSFKNTPNLEAFPIFLATKSFRRSGQSYNYYEYLTGIRATAAILSDMQGMMSQYLDTSQKYAILFTFYKEGETAWWEYVAYGAAAALTVAGLTVVVVTLTVGTGGIGTVVLGAGLVAAGSATGIVTSSGVVQEQVASSVGTSLVGGDWDAGIIITLLNTTNIKGLGCEELPVSLMGMEQAPQEP